MALAATVGLAALVAACSSDSGAGGGPDATPASVSATAGPDVSPAQPAEVCGGGPAVPAEPFWLSGARGTRLAAATVGTGSAVAVFVHESGMTGLCGF